MISYTILIKVGNGWLFKGENDIYFTRSKHILKVGQWFLRRSTQKELFGFGTWKQPTVLALVTVIWNGANSPSSRGVRLDRGSCPCTTTTSALTTDLSPPLSSQVYIWKANKETVDSTHRFHHFQLLLHNRQSLPLSLSLVGEQLWQQVENDDSESLTSPPTHTFKTRTSPTAAIDPTSTEINSVPNTFPCTVALGQSH